MAPKGTRAPQTRKDPKSIQGRLGSIRRVLPRPSKGTGYACALGRGRGGGELTGCLRVLEGTVPPELGRARHLIKPLQFKLQHYPCHDPTMVPDLRACKQVMSIKKAAQIRERKAAYEGHEDRQKGLDKAYSKDEIDRAGSYLLEHCQVKQMDTRQSMLTPYMNRVNWTWLQATMGRSQDLRSRECADLWAYTHEGLRPHSAAAVVTACLTTDAKHNKHRRREYIGALRHRDVRMCTTGALAAYTVCRWDLLKEKRPDFKSRDWYTLPLLVLKRGTKGKVKRVTYEAQRRPMKRMHDGLGVKSRQVTHKNRSSGAKYMARIGVDRDLILGFGRWHRSPYDKAYATDLQAKPLLAMAGVTGPALDHMRYTLPRSQVVPPPELLELVLSGFDKDLAYVSARDGELTWAERDESAAGLL